ncbi:MAG: hypothetical protein KJ697_00460 [Nanoarchaeota archaeon]|nr:hypothetical protein [Nanoarchaeota archaeon]
MKGISAVLATVLIVVITVAIIGMAYGWATGMFEMVGDTSEENVAGVTDNMLKSVQIVTAGCIGETITFSVRATGTKDIEAGELSVFLENEMQTTSPDTATTEITSGITQEFTISNAVSGSLKVSAPAGSVEEDVTC